MEHCTEDQTIQPTQNRKSNHQQCHSETGADRGSEETGAQQSQTQISTQVSDGEWQISDARRVSFLQAVWPDLRQYQGSI